MNQLPLFVPDSNWIPPEKLPDVKTYCAIDLETRDDRLSHNKGPGWATNQGYVCGVALAWREGDTVHAGYFPRNHPESNCFMDDQIRQWLKHHIEAGVTFIMHNASYDIGWMWRQWDIMPQKFDDTSCMAYMIDEQRLSYGLDACCKWRGLLGKNETLLRDAAQTFDLDPKKEIWRLPARYVGIYAEQDALCTLLLWENLQIELSEIRRAYDTEMALVPVVHTMQKRGIRINLDVAEQLYDKYKAQSKEALKLLGEKLCQTVRIEDVRKNEWLVRAFKSQKISFPQTEKGAPSFRAVWMREIDHWLPRLVLRAKSREDAAEKFVRGYLLDMEHNGRIHASVHQYRAEKLGGDDEERGGGTRTYRFAYSDPPLQQIPHRDEEMAEIRSIFIADHKQKWLSADYSQQEYRLMVHYAATLGLPKAEEAAQKYQADPNTDFHQFVADMTGLQRKPAKDANFAKAYGAGVRKFAMMTKKTQEEAAKIMAQYDAHLPFVKLLYEFCQKRAEEKGFINLLDGARIRFDWWFAGWRENQYNKTWKDDSADCRREEAERRVADPNHVWFNRPLRRTRCNKALNSLIQGGAARQTKIAMVACARAGHIPLLQVHDELCFSGPAKIADEIKQIMIDAVQLKVPMQVDIDIGPAWGKA